MKQQNDETAKYSSLSLSLLLKLLNNAVLTWQSHAFETQQYNHKCEQKSIQLPPQTPTIIIVTWGNKQSIVVFEKWTLLESQKFLLVIICCRLVFYIYTSSFDLRRATSNEISIIYYAKWFRFANVHTSKFSLSLVLKFRSSQVKCVAVVVMIQEVKSFRQ